jgi:hypothetical protein
MATEASCSPEGQLFSMDFMAAAVIFLLIMGMIICNWNFTKARMDETSDLIELERKNYLLSDMLVKTQGYPTSWENNQSSSNISALGLAKADRQISHDKVRAFKRFDEQMLRQILNLGSTNFELVMHDVDGAVLLRAGDSPAGDYAVKTSRIVMYEGRAAFFDITLWGKNAAGGIIQ